MMKIENMTTNRRLARLSLIPLAATIGLSGMSGCDMEEEGRGEDYVDFQLSDDPLVPNDYTPREFPGQHVADTTDIIESKLTTNEDYIRSLSLMAHYLGYGWVGGNGSDLVGDDMVAKREGETIVVQGNNEGSCEGYWCEKKTKLIFSNFDYTIDGNSFSIPGGAGAIVTEPSDSEPTILTGRIVNLSSEDQQFVGYIIKDVQSNWSKTDTHGFSHSVSVAAEISFAETFKTTVTGTVGHDHSWGSTNGGSESTQVKGEVRVTVPGRSVMPFIITMEAGRVTFPYEASVILSYDVTLDGFLRHGGHAHPTLGDDRPTHRYTFTVGRPTEDDGRDINHQWTHRSYLIEDDWWDWNKAIDIASESLGVGTDEAEAQVELVARNTIWPQRLLLEGVISSDTSWETNVVYGEITSLDDLPEDERPTEEGIFGDDGEEFQEGEAPE